MTETHIESLRGLLENARHDYDTVLTQFDRQRRVVEGEQEYLENLDAALLTHADRVAALIAAIESLAGEE